MVELEGGWQVNTHTMEKCPGAFSISVQNNEFLKTVDIMQNSIKPDFYRLWNGCDPLFVRLQDGLPFTLNAVHVLNIFRKPFLKQLMFSYGLQNIDTKD